ncbi:MAG TPA: EscU/YscU/HrcU family type III secretion system export apparatus switch protein [Candidatus Baltobacteraceae bacterium]|nr:EscU/YscU/HrcU family type III secretion system export apparatus switch protein [Candidatus Baltobacteraceae bacterium]
MNRFFDFRKSVFKRPAAAALKWDPQSSDPPEVVAVGRGITAETILRIAKEHNIPLYEDPGLVEALARLNVSDFIPRELYSVVAEVLAYVYRVDSAFKERAS